MADGPKPPKGALITGIVLLVLSLAACGAGGAGCVSFISTITDTLSEAGTTPLGEEFAFDSTGSTAVVFATSTDVTCDGVDSSGSPIEFNDPGGVSASGTSGGENYELAYTFDSREGERYRVLCESGAVGEGSYTVFNIPSLSGLGLGTAGIGSGVVLFVLGAIFLIVGLVRRSGWKKRTQGAMAGAGAFAGSVPPPPGGSYPPPPGGAGASPAGWSATPPAAPAPPPPGPPAAPPQAPPPPPAGPPPAPPAGPPPAPPAAPPPPPGGAQPPPPPPPG